MRRRLAQGLPLALTVLLACAKAAFAHMGGDAGEGELFSPVISGLLAGAAGYIYMVYVWDPDA